MPLCFWAAQTTAVALELHRVGTVGSGSTAYIPPHTAATTIQLAYHFCVHCFTHQALPDIAMNAALSEFIRMQQKILFNKPLYPFDEAIKFAYKLYINKRHWMKYMATIPMTIAGIGAHIGGPWTLLDNR
jgi:hypothetical protein